MVVQFELHSNKQNYNVGARLVYFEQTFNDIFLSPSDNDIRWKGTRKFSIGDKLSVQNYKVVNIVKDLIFDPKYTMLPILEEKEI